MDIETNCDKGYALRRRLAQNRSNKANTNDLGKAHDNGNKAVTHTHKKIKRKRILNVFEPKRNVGSDILLQIVILKMIVHTERTV